MSFRSLIVSKAKIKLWRVLLSQVSEIGITERLVEDLEDIINYINDNFTCDSILDQFSLPENFIEELLEQLETARKQLEKAML